MPTPTQTIQDRCFAFAVRIFAVVRALPANTCGFTLGKQLLRSGTSVGANAEEAKAAHSRPEFIRRMNIAHAEARETRYWLRLLAESGVVPRERLAQILVESEELVRILTATVKTAREK